MYVVGVDGCPGGWVAVAYDTGDGSLTARVHGSFAEVLAAYGDAAGIGIDIPIGLAEGVPRRCDVEARRVLGWPRRSSVFPAPDPRVLGAASYEEALARSRSLTGGGISRQAYGIYPRVLEVNRAMTPALQGRVVEVHPEVSFWALANGKPMEHHKRGVDGFEERRGLLAAALGLDVWSREGARGVARPAKADDVLDAIVAAWSARREAEERAGRLPAEPEIDGRGLRMEIVY